VKERISPSDEVHVFLIVESGDVEILGSDLVKVGELAGSLIAGHYAIDIAFVFEGLFCAAVLGIVQLEALPLRVVGA